MSDSVLNVRSSHFEKLGFTRERGTEGVACYGIGKPYCRLFFFMGYGDADWWACAGKYRTAAEAAHSSPHFDRRVNHMEDLFLICAAVGLPLDADLLGDEFTQEQKQRWKSFHPKTAEEKSTCRKKPRKKAKSVPTDETPVT